MFDKTLAICPRCQQRFVRAPNSGDYVHKCHTITALANEDVLVIGNWEDFTGSNFNVNQPNLQGTENTLQGTRADIEGEKEPGARTDRGFPKNRFRTRQHLEHIDSDYFKKKESSETSPDEYL